MVYNVSPYNRSRAWRGLLILALATYLVLATHQLGLPGLNYDEALEPAPAMQFVLGEPLDSYSTVHLFDRDWPLSVLPYVGGTTTYLLMPVFALFGPGQATLRLTLIGLGAVTLVVAWSVVRSLFDERLAGVATLLLAVSPAYVFWTRMGSYISLPLVPLALAVVWALHRWRETDRGRYLVVAGFCFGLGLTTKILFIWLPVALALAWLLLAPRGDDGRRDWLGPLHRTPVGAWLLAGGAALVGAAPFLALNLLHAGETVQLVRRNLFETELYGVSNLDMLTNLRIRFATDLVALLDGVWFADVLGGLHRCPFTAPALGVALLVILALWRAGRLAHPRRAAFLAILIVAITIQSAVTVSSLGAMHLAILWPWPQTLIALAAVGLLDYARDNRRIAWPVALLAGLLVVMPLASNLRTVLAYHHTMAQTGGRGNFSDAIFSLAADLDQPDVPQAVALDWGFKRNMQLLTGNRVIPEDGFTYSQQPGIEYRSWAEWRFEQGPALYIAHTPAYTAFGGHRELLEEAAYRTGRELTLWKEYAHRDGVPIYRVYSVAAAPPVTELPVDATGLEARFGAELTLLGHDPLGEAWQAGSRAVFHVYWQAETEPQADYKVFVHLSVADEQVMAQHDGVPMLWAYPTSAWQAGEIIADRIQLSLSEDLTPGLYRLWIGMYHEQTGERLSAVREGERLPDDRLMLAEIEVTSEGPR